MDDVARLAQLAHNGVSILTLPVGILYITVIALVS